MTETFVDRCSAVDAVCREGPARVMELVKLGTEFTMGAGGQLHLTRGAFVVTSLLWLWSRLRPAPLQRR